MKYAFIFFLSLSCLVFMPVAQAATQKPGLNYQKVADKAGYDYVYGTNIYSYIGFYIRIALTFVASLLVIYMLYAGYLWLTAGGNADQVQKAKDIIKNGVIGILIIASAYVITTTILSVADTGNSGTETSPNPVTVNP